MMVKTRRLSTYALVGLTCVLIGGVLFGNLFTLRTGEFPDAGAGYLQTIIFKNDMVVTLNTPNPETHLSGWLIVIPPPTTLSLVGQWWLSATGVMWVEPDGTYTILLGRHAGVLTTIGKNWIEDQMGDSPSTTAAAYISLSSSASSPSSTWTQIPSEIVDGNGLARALGTYASTGDGVWTISKQFTCTGGSYSNVQLGGINYAASGDGNLLTSDTFTPTSLVSGEKITVTDTFTITG